MTYNEVREFGIDKNKKTDCELPEDIYRVMKVKQRSGTDFETNFYAIKNKEFVRDSTRYQEKWYKGQIAYITCSHGLIDYIDVNEDLRPNARNCGIGTVLTELCFIDPEFYEVNDDNYSLKRIPVDGQHIRTQIKNECSRFIGLELREEEVGAYAFFSAAIRSGYTRLLIYDDRCLNTELKYKFFDVEVARSAYIKETGYIGTTPAFELDWLFCKRIE